MDVRPKVTAGKTAKDYEDPCEALEVSELCSVYRRPGLACTACLKQVLKNGLRENIVFAQEPRGKAQSRQRRKQLMYLPLPHTHIFKGRSKLPESLSFPALYSEFPLMMVLKC